MAASKDEVRFFLPARVADRWVRYLLGLQHLTLEGSAEPRKWIGCTESFWLGVASDSADWLRELGYGDQPPIAPGSLALLHGSLPATDEVTTIDIVVPPGVFEQLGCNEVELQASPLQCNQAVLALPRRNLRFDPATVKRTNVTSQLRVFDMHGHISGMQLRGVVWASRVATAGTAGAPVVVAAVCIDIP